ncbi:Fc.00g042350.m01.CDS01 [Cosmosporella sp. VM-42]
MSTVPTFEFGHTPSASAGTGQPSADLLNLSSNNPFRNRAASPSPASVDLLGLNKPASPFDDPPPRPLSRNPFLDQAPPLRSPGVMSTQSDKTKSLSAEEIFDSLTLDDKPADERPKPPAPRRPMDRPPNPPRRGENVPPPKNSTHHPTRSQEEALRARKMQGGPPRPGPANASPQRRPQRRPRRNSESSLMDFDAKPITDDEKRMIEAKRRERAERERQRRDGRKEERGEGRSDGKGRDKSGRPNRRMDIIDQLDATSIFGTGLFHHDGPFDALNPHRNRQNSRRAPMQAFPKDSLNNSLGGAGPLNNTADHSTFMGMATDEAFRDYSKGAKPNPSYYPSSRTEPPIFDPISRGSIVHGDESHGLGTSTFLEGTPAPRSAIVRRQAEQAQENMEIGLARKKSLAQRIRHINKGPRDFNSSGRMTNPEGAYDKMSPDGMSSARTNGSDNNPFFSEFSKGEESMTVRRRDGAMSPASPPGGPRRGSQGNALERRATTDATSSLDDAGAKPTGILGRMKSLKGGRRPRNVSGDNGPPAPGTAV